MYTQGRRGYDANTRDVYVRPMNGLEDVYVGPTTPTKIDINKCPPYGNIPKLDLIPGPDLSKARVFHFGDNTFGPREFDAQVSGPHEKIIIDVLRRRQEAKVNDLPSLATNFHQKVSASNNLEGNKTALLLRPQSPFTNYDIRRGRDQIGSKRSGSLTFSVNELAPTNTPTIVPEKVSKEVDTNDDMKENLFHRSTVYPRMDRGSTLLDRSRHSEGVRLIVRRGDGRTNLERAKSARLFRSPERRGSLIENTTNVSTRAGGDSADTSTGLDDHITQGGDDVAKPQLIPNITVTGDTSLQRESNSAFVQSHSETSHEKTALSSKTVEPEYIESFHQFNPIKHRRPASESLKDFKRKMLDSRVSLTLEDKDHNSRSLVRFAAWDSPNNEPTPQETDMCPNCHEKLVRVPSRYIAVRPDERNFFSWMFSKWQKRQDLQSFTAFKQHAYLPHYCHFVRGITLKGRGGGGDHEDEADDGYITNSEPSPLGSDIDLLRRSGRLRSGHVNSRSSSPIEQDNEPVSQMSRLSVGVDSGVSTSRQDLSCVGPDSGVFTGRLDLTYAETEGRKDLTSEKSVAEVESYETWDAHRPPIRIPSPDIEPVESSRNKIDEMADIVRELTTKTTKDVARAELTSATSRRLCPKKGKSSGTRGRKRRGKKKKHGDGSNQEKDGGESTLIADLKDGQFPQADGDALTAVNLNVPDLPSVNGGKQGKQSKGTHTKKNKTQIAAPVKIEKMKEAPPPPVYNFYDFGDLTDTKPDEMESAVPNVVPIPANLNDRMVLTLQSSRFELPMDMRELENLTPQDYLKKYCVVTPRRKLLYTKTFQDYRDKKGFILGKSSLCSALTCVLINSMDNDQAEQLCDLLEVDDKTEVDFDLFSGIAALAERILYPYFVTAETWDRTEFQKEMIECADFCALEWKLRGVNVSNQVKKILKSL
uniref:Uncharacterized protein n=1 Tax=Biomphalaria glabrata TaxID=6526 RepID=A0A2C9LKX7_BIOGL